MTASLDQASIRETIERIRAVRPDLATAVNMVRDADLAACLAPATAPAPRRVHLPVADHRTLATFVLGCGRGGVVRAIAASLAETDASTVVVVVETDPARMLATLTSDDWSAAIAEPRIRFAIGADPRVTLQAAVPEAPFCLLERALSPGVGFVAGDVPDRASEIGKRLDTASRIEFDRLKRTCLEQETKRRQPNGRPNLPDGCWRITSSVSRSTTALRHLAPSILDAAAAAGHTTKVHLADPDADPFSNSRSVHAFVESDPDLVLAFLRPGRVLMPWREDFPSLVLVSSNPRLLPIESFPWSERDLVVVTDPNFAESYRRLGLDPLVRSLATAVPSIDEMANTPAPSCDVLVVGNIPPASRVVDGMTRNLEDVIEAMAADWVQHPEATVEEVIATTNIRGQESFLDSVRIALGYETTRLRRIGAVTTLAEAGFSVRVHGEEAWKDVLAGTAAEGCWHGWMPSGVAQSAAFRRAGVSINVNSLATPNMINMRGFEVPAAGGVLVSDDRPALRAAFDVGTEVLAFRRLDELPDLVGDVLRDRDRRDAIATAARARVERDHSWDAWWAWAEKELRARFPSRK